MATKSIYDGIQHVVEVRTNEMKSCEECNASISKLDVPEFAKSVNHYIETHGYKLLHVGTDTCNDMNGNPWHSTIAVLGK